MILHRGVAAVVEVRFVRMAGYWIPEPVPNAMEKGAPQAPTLQQFGAPVRRQPPAHGQAELMCQDRLEAMVRLIAATAAAEAEAAHALPGPSSILRRQHLRQLPKEALQDPVHPLVLRAAAANPHRADLVGEATNRST